MLQLWSSRKLAAWGSFRGRSRWAKTGSSERGCVKWGAVHVCVTPRMARPWLTAVLGVGWQSLGLCQQLQAGQDVGPVRMLGHSVPVWWRSGGQMCFQTCTCLGRGPVPRDPR